MEDIQLMLRVKEGDAAAFDALVERHRDRVVNFLYRMIGDAAEAEDLAQEVFLRVYRARERYEPMAQFTTWLYRIAYNAGISHRRRFGRRPETLSDSAAPSPAPDDQLVSAESVGMMWQELHRLPPNQRTALVLTQLEECSYQQAAEVMNTSSAAIRSLISRARETLRERLRKYVDVPVVEGA